MWIEVNRLLLPTIPDHAHPHVELCDTALPTLGQEVGSEQCALSVRVL